MARAAERLGYVGAQLIPAGEAVPVGGATELPLAVGDERLGTLLLVGDRAPLAPSESRVLRLFADQLALASRRPARTNVAGAEYTDAPTGCVGPARGGVRTS